MASGSTSSSVTSSTPATSPSHISTSAIPATLSIDPDNTHRTDPLRPRQAPSTEAVALARLVVNAYETGLVT